MSANSNIAWTTHTWSPWIGCTAVSPGCDACYARELDRHYRYGLKKGEGPPQGVAPHWGAGAPRYRTRDWTKPLSWNRTAAKSGKRAFVFPSICDPFDNEVPHVWRHDFWKLILNTQNLVWLLLTKRIGNVSKMWPDGPPLNAWLGASVVNQEEADRDIPKLLATPAAKHFVSYEPALSAVNFGKWLPTGRGAQRDLHWVIVGGESSQGGAKARPFDLAWARSTIAQCRAAGVPLFVKQVGSSPYDSSAVHVPVDTLFIRDRAGADPDEWPENLRVQEFPS